MFEKRKSLQSKSEVTMRNIVIFIIAFLSLAFLVIPILMAFIGSFHDWNPLSGTFDFLGFDNYIRMFQDPVFYRSMINTVIFSLVVIFFRVALGLGLAYGINSKLIKNKTFYRTIYYMPTVTPLIAVAYVWQLMYQPQFGAINQIFGSNINWLYDSRFALLAIILMTIWKDFGYAVILFMSGLNNVPQEAIEAAKIDGASDWDVFKYITLPLLKPTTLFVVITSLISYLQAYIHVMVLTDGGPGTSTYVSSFIIFEEAFEQYNFGYASAIAFVLLILTVILTIVMFKRSGSTEDV